MFHVEQYKMFHVKQCKMFHVKQCTKAAAWAAGGREGLRRQLSASVGAASAASGSGGSFPLRSARLRLLRAPAAAFRSSRRGFGCFGLRRLLVAEGGSGGGSVGRSGAAERKRGGRRQTERLGWRGEGWRREAKQSEAAHRRPKPSKPRSGEQTKPDELQRPAPNEARSSRSRADWSGKLPPEPEEAEAAPTGAESCRRSPKQPKPRRLERKAAAGAPTKTAKGACPHAASPCRLPRLLTSAPCRLPRLLTSAARQTPMCTPFPHVRRTAPTPPSLRRGSAAAPLRGGRLTPHKS